MKKDKNIILEAQNDVPLILVMTCYKIERFNHTKSFFVVIYDNINQTNNIMCEVKNNDNQIKWTQTKLIYTQKDVRKYT